MLRLLLTRCNLGFDGMAARLVWRLLIVELGMRVGSGGILQRWRAGTWGLTAGEGLDDHHDAAAFRARLKLDSYPHSSF